MTKSDNYIETLIKQIGYKGCANCKHKPVPIKLCWQGENALSSPVCPLWEKEVQNDNN